MAENHEQGDSPDRHLKSVSSFDYEAALERAKQPEQVPDDLGNEALDLLFRDVAYEWYLFNDFARDSKPSFETNDEVTKTALRYLSEKPVGWDEHEPYEDEKDKGTKYQLALGGQAVAGIRFFIKGEKAELDFIGVHDRLARHGLGRRLMQSAVAFMKDRGVTELNSRNLSRDGFENRLAIFGPDVLSFYYTDDHRQMGLAGAPPANAKEARSKLDEAYANADMEGTSRGDAPPTFGVHVNLADVDDTNWERPVQAKVDELRVTYDAQDSGEALPKAA